MTQPRNAHQTARGRIYQWQDEQFVSVTTVISGGVPKPALKNWGERTVAEFAVDNMDTLKSLDRAAAVDLAKRAPYRSSDAAAARGSDVHDWAENYVLGHAIAVSDAPVGHQGYMKAFLKFLDEWQPKYEMTEASVYNRKYGYAGTLDALMHVPGLGLCLVDYKTSRGVYGETALQLASYRYAEFIGMPDGSEVPMPEVNYCLILHLKPRSYSFVPVEADETAFRYFLYAQQVRHFCEDVSKTVLLPAMRPVRPEDLN